MKLISFRIRNFRSIIDTGWQNLAFDNITTLIGQNESGKTSVLEGLKAFHDGHLIEDMLRSDLTLPEIHCRFSYEWKELLNILQIQKIDPGVKAILQENDTISITRKWDDEFRSYFEMGEEFTRVFNAVHEDRKKQEVRIRKIIDNVNKEIDKVKQALSKAEKEFEKVDANVAEVKDRISELKKNSRPLFGKGKKEDYAEEIRQEEEMLGKFRTIHAQKKEALEQRQAAMDALQQKIDMQNRLLNLEEKIHSAHARLIDYQEQLKNISRSAGMLSSQKEQRAAELKEELIRQESEQLKESILRDETEYDICLESAEEVFNGALFPTAYEEARKVIEKRRYFYNSQELGGEIFKITPDFELFEDFSSLLPNRIDLEDIATGNTSAEGYKAAINFLTIIGLDFSFFQQPTNRILKQKIENLNGEITLNFQDFWRQNVGKNNKIKINFELSHYDHTHPEKSGKPFIEFWIKDEKERLYPKQRSRGVRWFLSFFLELKATAMDKSQHNKILLIDEPGVSLHARAQEDVLKVFDDIREHIQIIYTTHSPHLIDVNKLYRILAVQRAVEDDLNSETLIFNMRSLRAATADTLSPIYSMMGARLNQQEIIHSFNNVVVKDIATFYFLKAIFRLTGSDKQCYFLPASGAQAMRVMVNILIGWGLEYVVLTFGNEEERKVHTGLRKELFDSNVEDAGKQLINLKNYEDAEDLFSTIDFKKHVIHVREGITVSNSKYLSDNNFSRAILASGFLQEVINGNVKFSDFDEETRDNLNHFVADVTRLLK
ncbi:MAG: AAA family ATPase [Bacteroidota bacterium]